MATTERPQGAPPRLEVVFVIDTTGSMSDLIEAARAKVWSIARVLAAGKPAPEIALGLVAYRDHGDAYVTRVTPLTSDLDAVYRDLMGLQADGGGDGPEHVNRALLVAARSLAWSAGQGVTRLVFLVGDAPPHMDYRQEPDWTTAVKEAVAKGIVVNAIRCGSDGTTEAVFREIAQAGGGRYISLAQDGGTAIVSTPHDQELATLRADLAATYVTYGAKVEREAREAERSAAEALPAAPAAAADRAAYLAKTGAALGERDLVEDAADGTVDLASLPDVELPEAVAGVAPEARKAKLDEIGQKRAEIEERIARLSKLRDEELARGAAKTDSFDAQVLEAIRAQAASNGIRYE